ncbi:Ribonuclease P protein subunit p21 [Entomortierella beljakovae]|nr:Ribonuclease P protein subunit p21 [Entomortierella beljakovae]
MAKKDKKGEGAVQNREIFQRMNFLYQAAMYMASITTQQTKSNSAEQGTLSHNDADGASDNTVSQSIENIEDVVVKAPDAASKDTTSYPPKKLSRRKKKEYLRQRKNKIAKEHISTNKAHHRLTCPNKDNDQHQLSGTARFYASTLREVGRKNVIRVDPVIKRTICQRCEAILIPSISCEVRIQAVPQLHTELTCTACGAFRRLFCMPGKGIERNKDDDNEDTKVEDDTLLEGKMPIVK